MRVSSVERKIQKKKAKSFQEKTVNENLIEEEGTNLKGIKEH